MLIINKGLSLQFSLVKRVPITTRKKKKKKEESTNYMADRPWLVRLEQLGTRREG